MATYLLNFSLFLAFFWVLYMAFFRKETFFNHNRVYLILAPIIAALLPFVVIPSLDFMPNNSSNWYMQTPIFLTNNTTATTPETAINAESSNTFSYINAVLLFYLLGFLFMLFKLTRKIIRFRKLKTSAKVIKVGRHKIYQLTNSDAAFTFFNSVFIGDSLKGAKQSKILQHELVHKRHKHSFDLLYYEVLKVICWFHPVVYSLQNQLRLVHEYTADALVVQEHNKINYTENILNGFFQVKGISFTNQFFNHSLIKKRIIMLHKTKSQKIALLKYLMLLPVLAIMLTYVSCTQENATTKEPMKTEENVVNGDMIFKMQVGDIDNLTQEESATMADKVQEAVDTNIKLIIVLDEGKNQKPITVNANKLGVPPLPPTPPSPNTPPNPTESGVPYSSIDVVPAYQGCDQNQDNDSLRKCTSEKISEFVNANFNTNLGKELDLEGVNRVYVRFTIAKDGIIKDVQARAPHPDLQEEAVRVVKSLPKMQPGMQNGKPVNVLYSLPIVFKIN